MHSRINTLLRFLWLAVALVAAGLAILASYRWSQSEIHRAIGLQFDWVAAFGSSCAFAVALFLPASQTVPRVLCLIALSVLLTYHLLYLLIGGEGWWMYRYLQPIAISALCVASFFAIRSPRRSDTRSGSDSD
jgi:hypothetical protein